MSFWLWLAFVTGWVALRWPAMRRARKQATRKDRRDGLDIGLLVLCAIGLFVFPLVWRAGHAFSGFNHAQTGLMTIMGVAVGAGFLWLFRRSHKDLGRNWSVSLEIHEGHSLVSKGVYCHVRHPMYASFFLWGIMQALLIPNWIAGGAGLISVALLFALRHRREEGMMRAEFGADYDAYCARTARLLPGLF